MDNMMNREFKEPITILSVGKPWSMADENNKVFNQGCTMWYVTGDVTEVKYDEKSQQCGRVPVKKSMPPEFHAVAKMKGLPMMATGVFVMRDSGKGITLELDGVLFGDESNSSVISAVEGDAKEPVKKGK